ncbi:N-acetyltransferase GCN5 [Flammeovirgaceae bacterium 311]|nr:N-acetyltransferase GCN5 [Flammeovirgaceae bacterium 311]
MLVLGFSCKCKFLQECEGAAFSILQTMMKIDTLRSTSTAEIRYSFNEAFREYFVPVNLSQQQIEQKLLAEGFEPSISAGVFVEGKLGGFILHSSGQHKGKRTAYNSGTGIIAAHRGQHLVPKMYEYLLPLLIEKKYDKSLLEFIRENKVARQCYEKVGFQIVRELLSFKGEVAGAVLHAEVEEIMNPDWLQLQTFWDWEPSWQHSLDCLKRASGSYKTYGIYKEGGLRAYVVINPLTNRIPSFAVAPGWRNKGLATALFRHLQQVYRAAPLTMINVDSQQQPTINFVQSIGLKPLLTQYEMELMIQ